MTITRVAPWAWLGLLLVTQAVGPTVVHAQPEVHTPPKIRVPAPPDRPELFVNLVAGDDTHYYPASPGMGPDRLRLGAIVGNRGPTPVPPGCEVDFVLSADAKASPDDRLLGRVVLAEAIPPGTSARAGSVLMARRDYGLAGIPPGWYYVCANVDPRNRVLERDETNNGHCPTRIQLHEAGSTTK